MAKQHLLKPEDRAKFDELIQKWRIRLNLQNWRVEKSTKPTKAMAEVNIQPEDRLASYSVGRSFGSTPVTDISLEQTAVHELLHVMLREYADAVKSGSDEFAMAAEHSIITVLENLLVPRLSVSTGTPTLKVD
jgi:hypothetical protein